MKKKLYNVPVSLSDESSSIPLQSKHRCYCLVRWFWSSTLHRGINNKRQYSWSNRKSRYFVRKKGENSIKRMTKWMKLVDDIHVFGRSWKIDLFSWWIFFPDDLFKNQMQKIWKFQCVNRFGFAWSLLLYGVVLHLERQSIAMYIVHQGQTLNLINSIQNFN